MHSRPQTQLVGVQALGAMCRSFLGPASTVKAVIHDPGHEHRNCLVASTAEFLHAVSGEYGSGLSKEVMGCLSLFSSIFVLVPVQCNLCCLQASQQPQHCFWSAWRPRSVSAGSLLSARLQECALQANVICGGLCAQERAVGCGGTWLVVLAGLLIGSLQQLQQQGAPTALLLHGMSMAMDVCQQVGAYASTHTHGRMLSNTSHYLFQSKSLLVPLSSYLVEHHDLVH